MYSCWTGVEAHIGIHTYLPKPNGSAQSRSSASSSCRSSKGSLLPAGAPKWRGRMRK